MFVTVWLGRREHSLAQHESWYCKSDEAFVTESQVMNVTNADGTVKKVRAAACGAGGRWIGSYGSHTCSHGACDFVDRSAGVSVERASGRMAGRAELQVQVRQHRGLIMCG